MIRTVAAPAIKNRKVLVALYVYAALLVIASVGMLVRFDKFVPMLAQYVGGQVGVVEILVAVTLVSLQIGALPAVLRMRMSPLAWAASVFCAGVVPALWLVCAIVVLAK